MNNTTTHTIEEALATYKETVSPSQQSFQVILSHIPEQQKQQGRRVIRSPYMWLAFTQTVMLCSILFVAFSFVTEPAYQSNPFYQIDLQVDNFETTIMEEDSKRSSMEDAIL